MKPKFKKGDKVQYDLDQTEWTVVDIVKRDDSYQEKYLYLVERKIKVWFKTVTIRDWKIGFSLNKFIGGRN